MKKELIQEVKRIKQIMNINEGWGSVFRASFSPFITSRPINSLYKILDDLEGFGTIDSQLKSNLRSELSFNADTFVDALDTIAERMGRISDQSDFNKVFDEFIDALDSMSATKLSDDIRKIENATTQSESDSIKLSTTVNMDADMGKLYKKRLDSVTWRGSNGLTPLDNGSSVLQRANTTLDELMDDKMFKRMYPDDDTRKTLIKEAKDLVNRGNIQLNNRQEVNDYLLRMKPRYEEFAKRTSEGTTLKMYDQIKATQESCDKIRAIIDEVGKTGERLIGRGSDIISKGVEGTGKIARSTRNNTIAIGSSILLVLVALGVYHYTKAMPIIGPVLQGGKEEVKELITAAFEAVDESVKDNGGKEIPEVKPEETKPEETKPEETKPVVKTPKTSQDSIEARLKGKYD